ncbi:hypothetical protein KKH50_00655, partial [Patescibacteria group bacterium]|nr:hypothetical protein [Patescibacteria group bacterium]
MLPKVFKHKKPLNKLYLAILISDSSIQVAFWQVGSDGATILKKSTKRSYRGQNQALEEVDRALQELGKQSEDVNEVVFGFQPTWAENQGVATVKKPFLKAITQELDLDAVGFVITSEALALQLTVNNPRLCALLIEFSQHELYLSLIDQGKLVSTKFVGRSDQTIADMTEALARLNVHLEAEAKFPSKMLLSSLELSQAELMEQQQLLLEHDWVNSHPFVHSPTVEILDSDLAIDAVVKQGGVSITGVEDSKPEPTQATSFGVKVKLSDLQAPKFRTPEPPPSNQLHEDKPDKLQSGIKMKMFSWFGHHKLFAIGGFISGLLALGIISWVWLSTSVWVQVILDLKTQTISSEAVVTLDPNTASSDIEKLILSANTVKKQVSGSWTKETTGTKLVGDKAIGKVILYNKTDGVKTFDKG